MTPAKILTRAGSVICPRHVYFALAWVAALDLYLLLVTAPHLQSLSGGKTMFDLRIGGYSHQQALAYLAALGAEGRAYYLARHIPVDVLLAVVEAAAIGLIVLLCTRPDGAYTLRLKTPARLLLLALPAVQCFCDLAENALIAAMLMQATGAGAGLVRAASSFTAAKWVAGGGAIVIAFVLSCAVAYRWFRQMKRRG